MEPDEPGKLPSQDDPEKIANKIQAIKDLTQRLLNMTAELNNEVETEQTKVVEMLNPFVRNQSHRKGGAAKSYGSRSSLLQVTEEEQVSISMASSNSSSEETKQNQRVDLQVTKHGSQFSFQPLQLEKLAMPELERVHSNFSQTQSEDFASIVDKAVPKLVNEPSTPVKIANIKELTRLLQVGQTFQLNGTTYKIEFEDPAKGDNSVCSSSSRTFSDRVHEESLKLKQLQDYYSSSQQSSSGQGSSSNGITSKMKKNVSSSDSGMSKQSSNERKQSSSHQQIQSSSISRIDEEEGEASFIVEVHDGELFSVASKSHESGPTNNRKHSQHSSNADQDFFDEIARQVANEIQTGTVQKVKRKTSRHKTLELDENKTPMITVQHMTKAESEPNSIPSMNNSKAKLSEASLTIIREDDKEQSALESEFVSSQASSHSKISVGVSLPQLVRNDTVFVDQNDCQDPMTAFIQQVATALRMNPIDLLRPALESSTSNESEQQQQHRIKKRDIFDLQQLFKNYRTARKTEGNSDDLSPGIAIMNRSPLSMKLSSESLNDTSAQELLYLKVQMNIACQALRKSLAKVKALESDLVAHVNKQTDMINKHEKKVRMFMKNLIKQNKELHFAFMFACPLVLSFGKFEQEKYKLIPKIDYDKEYLKIKTRLEAAQCAITITKRQCTIESFRQILMDKPIGIHFSGHGILNTFETVGEYHELHKDEGDFLLFETDEGDSQLVSRTQLKKLLASSDAKLDFVFVASCHSEFVGRIFLEAGSKHVICIDHKFEVDDSAVVTFTEAFYDAIFSNSANICKAFRNAQVIVNISHNETQANNFKLLLHDSLKESSNSKSISAVTPMGSIYSSAMTKQTVGQSTESKSISLYGLTSSSITSSLATPNDQKQTKSGSLFSSPKMSKKHSCTYFGKFPKGMYKEVHHDEPTLQIGSIDQPIFVAREKNMFRLIQKILSPKSSRLLTLLGLPGIGKSSLARKTLQHINERALLPGGYIMLNVRSIKHSEVFLREFNNSVLARDTNTFNLFGFITEPSTVQHDSFAITNLVLEKIASMQRKTLLVIDNAEDLISCDKNNFKNLVQYFLSQVPTLHVLLTTRCRLKFHGDLNEEIMLLYGLPTLQSMLLFSKMSRELTQREINELLRTKPDMRKYPSEKSQPSPKKLQDHHLFRMLGGNPATIAILAPMLADQDRAMDLVTLYKTLCADTLETDADPMVAIMRSSVHISLQSMQTSDPECLELLYLLALLPGGILPKDLDIIWKALPVLQDKEKTSKQQNMDGSPISEIEGENYEFSRECKWKGCFLKFRKHRLIAETKPQNQGLSWKRSTLLSLPEVVQSFAEAQISQESYAKIEFTLAVWFRRKMAGIFERNQNQLYVTEDSKTLASETIQKLQKFEANFLAFIQRQVEAQPVQAVNDLQQPDPKTSEEPVESLSDVRIKLKDKNITTSSESDISSSSMNEEHGTFQDELMIKITQIQEQKSKFKTPSSPTDDTRTIKELTSNERARARWQTACKLVKRRMSRSRLTNVKLPDGEVEEATDSDNQAEFEQLPIMNKGRTNTVKMKTPVHRARTLLQVQEQESSVTPRLNSNMQRTISVTPISLNMVKTKTVQSQMRTPRTSVKSFMSCGMRDSELAMVYYVANLILIEHYSLARSIIEKQLLQLKDGTNTFVGNVRRMQGLCGLQVLQAKVKKMKFDWDLYASKDETEMRIAKIRQYYHQAVLAFTKDEKNLWGLALTYYQHAELLYFSLTVQQPMFAAVSKPSESPKKQEVRLSYGQSKVLEKAMKKLQFAREAFKELKHYRGLAMVVQLSSKLEQLRFKSDSKSSISSGATFMLQSFGSGSQTRDTPVDEFEQQYRKHMNDFREQQRHLPFGDMRQELCITRYQGESMSLCIEIVKGVPDKAGVFAKCKLLSQYESYSSKESDSSSDEELQFTTSHQDHKLEEEKSDLIPKPIELNRRYQTPYFPENRMKGNIDPSSSDGSKESAPRLNFAQLVESSSSSNHLQMLHVSSSDDSPRVGSESQVSPNTASNKKYVPQFNVRRIDPKLKSTFKKRQK